LVRRRCKGLLQHAPHDVGERAVDARLLDEMRLAHTFVLRDGNQDRVLPRREIAHRHFALEDVACTLTGPMQQVNRRTFQPADGHFACLVTCHDCLWSKRGMLDAPTAR
jgi:hypothetical protein